LTKVIMADLERNERNIAKVEKLRKMTGRTESLVLIEGFLDATSIAEALKNREEIEKIDKVKRIFGMRPFTKQSSSKELRREASFEQQRHSLESFDDVSFECTSRGYYSDSEESLETLRRTRAQVRRLEKLRKLTGRSNSLVVIQDLICSQNEAEANRNARTLEKSDKMKKLFGERPSNGILLSPIS